MAGVRLASYGRPIVNVLSAAVRKYIRLIANPMTEPLCGMPVSPVLMTQADRAFVRGTFESSTVAGPPAGFAFIVASPAAAATNPNTCVETSSATSATNVISTAGAAGDVLFNSNSTWTNASIGNAPAVQFRTVAACLRVRNITPQLSKGGRGFGLQEPAHNNLNGLTLANIGAREEAGSFDVEGRDWTNLLYRPVNTADYDFKSAAINIGAANDGGFMTFVVQAPAGAPQTFEFEFWVVTEYQGEPVRHLELSPSDPVGAEAAHTVLVASQKMRKPHTHDAQLADKAETAASHVVSHHASGTSNRSSSSSSSSNGKAEKPGLGHEIVNIVDDVGETLKTVFSWL